MIINENFFNEIDDEQIEQSETINHYVRGNNCFCIIADFSMPYRTYPMLDGKDSAINNVENYEGLGEILKRYEYMMKNVIEDYGSIVSKSYRITNDYKREQCRYTTELCKREFHYDYPIKTSVCTEDWYGYECAINFKFDSMEKEELEKFVTAIFNGIKMFIPLRSKTFSPYGLYFATKPCAMGFVNDFIDFSDEMIYPDDMLFNRGNNPFNQFLKAYNAEIQGKFYNYIYKTFDAYVELLKRTLVGNFRLFIDSEITYDKK